MGSMPNTGTPGGRRHRGSMLWVDIDHQLQLQLQTGIRIRRWQCFLCWPPLRGSKIKAGPSRSWKEHGFPQGHLTLPFYFQRIADIFYEHVNIRGLKNLWYRFPRRQICFRGFAFLLFAWNYAIYV